MFRRKTRLEDIKIELSDAPRSKVPVGVKPSVVGSPNVAYNKMINQDDPKKKQKKADIDLPLSANVSKNEKAFKKEKEMKESEKLSTTISRKKSKPLSPEPSTSGKATFTIRKTKSRKKSSSFEKGEEECEEREEKKNLKSTIRTIRRKKSKRFSHKSKTDDTHSPSSFGKAFDLEPPGQALLSTDTSPKLKPSPRKATGKKSLRRIKSGKLGAFFGFSKKQIVEPEVEEEPIKRTIRRNTLS